MASPAKKLKEHQDIRSAIALAAVQGRAHVIVDARPCSIEIGRNAKGELSWNAKIYCEDAKATLDSVGHIKTIEDAINEKFNNSK